MRYSKFFGKTVREGAKVGNNVSTDLLYRGGYIRESAAGRYFLLPLGLVVHDKIIQVVREEMNKAGAQEMMSPVLHPLELWKETNRTKTAGFELMKVKDRRGAKFALGGTAEEMFVDVVRKFQISYRDVPFNIYQFSMKFRDELRARGGLLRVREFVMKDAYSFSRDEAEFKQEYDKMAETYTRIFERLGLKTYIVEADNGYIGGEYCHEFVVESPVGESRFFVTEDGSCCAHEDVAKFMREEVGLDEEIKPLQIVAQPKWVMTMEENMKHYGMPKGRYLKNVVYKHRVNGKIYIAAIRGDLEVNKTKLEHAIGAVGQLEDATDEDLTKLGTKSGYVHSWGHKGAHYIGDISLTKARNLIGGQKEDETDSFNVNYGRDFTCEKIADIALAKPGDLTEDGKKLVEKKGIEVGNIFQLGYHYTSLMKGAEYTDEKGQKQKFYMGCYGIGIGRTMATIVEKYNDEKGIKWPQIVSPYQAHLIDLNHKGQGVYDQLITKGIDVLWDDRLEETAGEKFADADLLGIPVRLVVSDKTGEKIEWKKRNEKQTEMLTMDEVVERLV